MDKERKLEVKEDTVTQNEAWFSLLQKYTLLAVPHFLTQTRCLSV